MLTELAHPLVAHWLAELRDVGTPPPRFRDILGSLSCALFLEATRDLPLASRPVRTPLAELEGAQLESPPLLVPILRAGLGMAEPIHALLPEATVLHVGVYRDHETLQPVRYYTPQVGDASGREAFVLDPMLATGGSAVAAISIVKSWDVARVTLLGVIGAPEGVARVGEAHPVVPIYLCALDDRLNDLGYIVPGLGDAGDRQFGAWHGGAAVG